MKKNFDIELTEESMGRNVTVIDQITVKWDRKSFKIEDYIDFHIVLIQDNERKDITDSYDITVKSLGRPDTISIPNSIIFKKVRVEYNRKVRISDWGESF